jgi:hypothetical protein
MSTYFVKYKKIAVHITFEKLSCMHTIIILDDEKDFDIIKQKSSYAGSRKFNLEEQLISTNLKRTLPKDIKNYILNIPDIKIAMRYNKIDDILK